MPDLDAIRTVLAAYRSGEAIITQEQITAAWATYDALRLGRPEPHPEARPGVDYQIVWVCPVCGGQANYLKLGRAECDGFNGTKHPGPVSCESALVMPWDGTLAADRQVDDAAA